MWTENKGLLADHDILMSSVPFLVGHNLWTENKGFLADHDISMSSVLWAPELEIEIKKTATGKFILGISKTDARGVETT